MWQDFKDFITLDPLHIVCFWSLIILAVTGLIEIIYQICSAIKKINIADEYVRHIDVIQRCVINRLQPNKRQEPADNEDSSKLEDSLHFVQVNYEEARKSIGHYNYVSDPIYALYSMLYNMRWNDRDVFEYCHQIAIDYEIGRKKHQKEIKHNVVLLFVPFAKLYRGFCVLFRLLTFTVKKLFNNFDKSGKWEASIAAIAEIFTLVNAIIEFVKHAS